MITVRLTFHRQPIANWKQLNGLHTSNAKEFTLRLGPKTPIRVVLDSAEFQGWWKKITGISFPRAKFTENPHDPAFYHLGLQWGADSYLVLPARGKKDEFFTSKNALVNSDTVRIAVAHYYDKTNPMPSGGQRNSSRSSRSSSSARSDSGLDLTEIDPAELESLRRRDRPKPRPTPPDSDSRRDPTERDSDSDDGSATLSGL